MSRAWIAVGAVVLVAGAAAGYFVIRAKTPDLAPAGPNRDLAPETLAFYAEVPALGATWSKMQTTDAWRDFAASGIAERALAAQPVKDLLAAVDQISTKADYRMTERNALKFVGREVSVGLALDPKGGPPQVLVLTKLDVDALINDLLIGKTDLDSLWAELQRRTGKLDFVVSATDYKDHKIATAARGATQYHAALLGDTLAVSTDAALLRASVDCRIAGGAKSLGRKLSFRADVKAAGTGAALFEWYDLDAMDAARPSLDAGLASVGADRSAVAAVHGLLDGTRGAHSFARSTFVPGGDLYQAKWTYSKSADLFADQAAPALRDLVYGDWLFYAEMRDIGGVAKAWEGSALKRRLGEGEIGKWLDGAMDEPAKRVRELTSRFAGGGVPFGGAADPAAAGAEKESELVDRFTVRMGRHLLSEQIANLVNGEMSMAVDTAGDFESPPRFVCSIRLDTEGRLAALAVEGALAEMKAGEVTSEECGTRRVYTAGKEFAVHWAMVGDALVVASDLDLVRQAARSGDTKPLGPPPSVRDAAAAMKPGWRGFAHIDLARLRGVVESKMKSDPSMGPFGRMFDPTRIGGRIAAAAYLPDDFSSFEIRTRAWASDSLTPEERAILALNAEERAPRCWSSLPDSTIAHVVNASSGVSSVWMMTKALMQVGGADLKEVESSFRESMGMDLEKDLVPALGEEVVFAVTYRAPAPAATAGPGPAANGRGGPPGGPPILLPGFVLGIEVKNSAVVRRAIERALELAEQKMQENSATSAGKPFVREARDGVEIVRLELPPEEQASVLVRPALALHDGYLLISTEVDALRAGIDAKIGKGKSLADSPVFARAVAAIGRRPSNLLLLDWSLLVDQIGVYAPQMGGLVPGAEVPYPEFPPDGNAEEWQRRVDEYQKKMTEARKSGGETVKKWLDSLRVVDYVAEESQVNGPCVDGSFRVEFTK